MANSDKVIIIIPARLDSSRLKKKLLMEIEGRSMITHVWERAVSANIGKVLVATDSIEIGEQIHVLGGDVIITEKNHVSGTDRVYEAIEKFDPEKKFQIVVNLQGDLPLIEKDALDKVVQILKSSTAGMGTLASLTPMGKDDLINENIVKVQVRNKQAVNFLRNVSSVHLNQINQYFHHIGIYSFKRKILEKFVTTESTLRERSEKLEQLRAMDIGIKIEVAFFKPQTEINILGVDTIEDLELVRKVFDNG